MSHPGNIITVTDREFSDKVLRSPTPVVVDFWAAWCGPCRMIAPLLEELAPEYEGRLIIAKMNVDENPETPAQYGIRGIPTLIAFKDGKPVDQLIGAVPKPYLKQFFDRVLGLC
jgi:thioredoxin 1